ncbi:MAG: hypothetical protein EAZ53_05890 [Bacteroidetes bacterium]|nr:MAG: hypothetical protein EAZ53_05890 [Bacteroidota bacterium]
MKNFILILLSYCLIFSCKQKESISGGEVKIITPEYVLDKDIVRFIKEYIQSTDNLYAKNLCMYVYKLSGRYTVIQLESNNYACNNNSGESNIIIDDKK